MPFLSTVADTNILPLARKFTQLIKYLFTIDRSTPTCHQVFTTISVYQLAIQEQIKYSLKLLGKNKINRILPLPTIQEIEPRLPKYNYMTLRKKSNTFHTRFPNRNFIYKSLDYT